MLVVDDAEEVREVLRELLSRHGYEVVTRPDGESGLVEPNVRPRDGECSLPGISSLALANYLKARWPATQVALMTG